MKICAVPIFLIVGLFTVASGQNPNVLEFRGMREIGVVVKDLPGEANGTGLTKDKIRADIETKLRGSGLTIAHNPTCATPTLYVALEKQPGVRGVLRSELHQCSLVSRGPTFDIVPESTIWFNSEPVAAGNLNARRIQDMANHQADMFLNQWISVNPKAK